MIQKKRINNDVFVRWGVFTPEGLPVDLTEVTSITIEARPQSSNGRYPMVSEVVDNFVEAYFLAKDQKVVGKYNLYLTYTIDDPNIIGGVATYTIDYCDAFELLPKSCFVDGEDDVDPVNIQGIIASFTYSMLTEEEKNDLASRISGNSGAQNLSDLLDVTISNLEIDQILKYDGTKWVNANSTGGSSSNVSWGIPTSQYTPLTVNGVTRNLSLNNHTHHWDTITNRPLTDAQFQNLLEIADLWKLDNDGNLYTERNVYSHGGVSAYNWGESPTPPVGVYNLKDLLDVGIINPQEDNILRFNGSHWVNVPSSNVGTLVEWSSETDNYVNLLVGDSPKSISLHGHKHEIEDINNLQDSLDFKQDNIPLGDIAQYYRGDREWAILNTDTVVESTNLYYTPERVIGLTGDLYAQKNHTHTFNSLTGLPNTLDGYGIIDAYNKTEIDNLISSTSGFWVKSVGLEAPTGFTVSNSPIIYEGNIKLSFASGYSLPSNSKQYNWDLAFFDSHTHTNISVLNELNIDDVNNWNSIQEHLNDYNNPHQVSFNQLNNKPSTLLGYGITNVYNKSEVDYFFSNFTPGDSTINNVYGYDSIGQYFSNDTLTDTFNAYTINRLHDRLTIVEQGGSNQWDPILDTIINWYDNVGRYWLLDASRDAIYTDKNVYSTKGVSAYGFGDGGGGSGGAGALFELSDTSVASRVSGDILIYNGTHWENRPQSSIIVPSLTLGETDTTAYRGDRGKIAYDHSEEIGNPHNTTFAQLESKPDTLSGFGITDAVTSTVFDNHKDNINDEKHLTQAQLTILTNLSDWWKVDSSGNLYTEKNLYSTKGVSAYGLGSEGGGGSGEDYERLDRWVDYDSTRAGWVLSAFLGKDLDSRVSSLSTRVTALESGSGSGSVTSVGLTVPTGLSVTGSPITDSGTLAISLTSGYSIPTTAKQNEWDTAYSNYHTHSNKTVLDGITSTNITNWGTAYTNNHTHGNKSVIDALTQGHIDVLDFLSVVDGNIKVDTTLWSTGGLSAYGLGSGGGGGGGADMLDDWTTYTEAKADYYAPASLLVPFRSDTLSRLTSLENGSATSITTTGSGNAVTSISKSGNAITATKGSTFALSNDSRIINGQTAFGWGDHASAGYALNSALNNYLLRSGGLMTGTISYQGDSDTPMFERANATFSYNAYVIGKISGLGGTKGLGISSASKDTQLIFGNWSTVATMDSTWDTILHTGNLKLGVTNLITGTSREYKNITVPGPTTSSRVSIDGAKAYIGESGTSMVSIHIKGVSGTGFGVRLGVRWGTESSPSGNSRYSPLLYEDGAIVLEVQSNPTYGWIHVVLSSNTTALPVQYAMLKAEKATLATDYSPAPEDQVSDWSITDATLFSYIKNKPTQLSHFTDNIGVGTHIANTSNPHSVSKSQVGLGNVDNVKQATKSEFDTHTENTTAHITSTERTNWNDANDKKHTHSNKALLDLITQSNIDVLAKLSIVNGNIKVDTSLWATEGISAYGLGSGGGSGGGGVDMLDSWANYTTAKANYYVPASLLTAFRTDALNRLTSLESGSATSITTTGTGNAITGISKSGSVITATKGSTFALSSHNHNTLYKAIGYVPTWGEVTGKPGTFTPATHTHSNISITAGTGLSGGGALSESRTLSIASTYAPNTSTSLGASKNLNNYQTAGFYHQTANANATTALNYPVASAGSLLVQTAAGVIQTYKVYNSSDVYVRGYYSTSWSAWRKLVNANDSIPWGRITGAPTTATTHPTWAQVTDKPGTFAPSSHTHTSAQISDATSANTASRVVVRNASGNFSAGTITATLSGNASSATKLGAATVGSTQLPIYLNSGTATAITRANLRIGLFGATAIGSTQLPIYLAANGVPTAITRANLRIGVFGTTAIGSTTRPIYIAANGVPTAITGSIANSTTGSAATLTTTRTIWGQNFNGSANVSGAITGATTGSFSSTVTASRLIASSAMTNGNTAAFTNPHLTLGSTANTDTTGFVGMTFATSSSTNYGFSLGAQRTTSGNGNLIIRSHVNSAVGTEVFRIANNGTVTASTFSGALSGNASSASNLSRSILAGNGLTGGGELNANRTLTLGTPSNITLSSTNSVADTSHAHNLVLGGAASQYLNGATTLVTIPTITAGNGLTGGGQLTQTRTVTLGTPSTLTNATTNNVATQSHTHAITTTTVGAASTIVATDASGGVRGSIIRIGGNWTLELSGTELWFKYGGVVKQKMFQDGSFAATGGVAAYSQGEASSTLDVLRLNLIQGGGDSKYLSSTSTQIHFDIGGVSPITMSKTEVRKGTYNNVNLGTTTYPWTSIYGVNLIASTHVSTPKITLGNGWTIEQTAASLTIRRNGVVKGTFTA